MSDRLRAYCVLVFLVLASSTPLSADSARNTKPFSRFKIFLEGILNDTLPFDVPFIVWGDSADINATHVTLRIAVIGSGTSCSGIPEGQFELVNRVALQKWTESDFRDRDLNVPGDLAAATRKQFEFVVRPLAPSKFYCFLFQTEPGRALTNQEVAALQSRLAPTYLTVLRSLGRVPAAMDPTVERIRQQLAAALLNAVPLGGFRPLPGSDFDPAADPVAVSNSFKNSVRAVLEQHNRVIDRLAEFQGMNDPGRQTMAAALSAWRSWVESPAFRALQSNATVPSSNRQILAAEAGRSPGERASLIVGLPPGTSQVLTEIQPNPTLAQPSTGALYVRSDPCPSGGELGPRCARLDTVLGELDTVQASVSAIDPTLTAAINGTIDDLSDQKSALLHLQQAVNARQDRALEHVRTLGGTILNDFTALVTTYGNFDTRRTWYLSADTGVAVAPELGEIFPYVGTNIYFRPVNKQAPPTVFLSRFSALVGFTWTSNLIKPGETKSLYGSAANLLLGAGLRATDVLRFNGGVLVLKGLNPNPLINRTRLEITPYFSFSADIDLAGIMGGLFGGQEKPPATLGGGARN